MASVQVLFAGDQVALCGEDLFGHGPSPPFAVNLSGPHGGRLSARGSARSSTASSRRSSSSRGRMRRAGASQGPGSGSMVRSSLGPWPRNSFSKWAPKSRYSLSVGRKLLLADDAGQVRARRLPWRSWRTAGWRRRGGRRGCSPRRCRPSSGATGWAAPDGRIDALLVQVAVQHDLPLGDIAGQVGDGVCDIVVGHGQNGNLRYAALRPSMTPARSYRLARSEYRYPGSPCGPGSRPWRRRIRAAPRRSWSYPSSPRGYACPARRRGIRPLSARSAA